VFTISTTMFEVLWEALRLPPMPPRLAVRQHGTTLDERNELRDRTLADAARRGLRHPHRTDRDLAGLLDLLARHDRGVSLRELTNRRRRAYAAADGPYGAIGVIQDCQVSLYAVPGDHLVAELLKLLPRLPAGAGGAVSLPTTVFEAAMAAYSDPRDSTDARRVLTDAGVGGKHVERLLATARDLVDTGSIGVHTGRHTTVALTGSLGYTDTTSGRYTITRRDDHAGRSHTTVAPTDPDTLRRRVIELLGGRAGPWAN